MKILSFATLAALLVTNPIIALAQEAAWSTSATCSFVSPDLGEPRLGVVYMKRGDVGAGTTEIVRVDLYGTNVAADDEGLSGTVAAGGMEPVRVKFRRVGEGASARLGATLPTDIVAHDFLETIKRASNFTFQPDTGEAVVVSLRGSTIAANALSGCIG